MRRKTILTLISLTLFISIKTTFSQGELRTEKEIFIRNEWSLGITVLNNGWGFDYRYGKHINAFKKHLYEINFNTIRHPKEIKLSNPFWPSTSRYVYGKVNNSYDFKIGKGRQKTLFTKEDKGSVEVRLVYFGGISLNMLKPIYYEVRRTGDIYETIKFNKSLTVYDIIGKASFFKGITETDFVPGAYTRLAVSFEHGKLDSQIRAVEAGVSVYGYLKPLEIMISGQTTQFFVSIFVNYRFGKVFHGAQFKNLNEKDTKNILE